LYLIDDHDPVAYWRMLMTPSNRYETGAWYVYNRFLAHVSKTYPDKVSHLLAYSDIIAHVRVIDTFSTIHDSSLYVRRTVGVTCEVLDTIKGHHWPSKKFNRRSEVPGIKLVQLVKNHNLQFEYAPTWNRMWDLDLVNEDSSDWISKGKEYIVFLRFQRLTTTNSSIVLTLWPTMSSSTMGTMYPIESGIVQDPNDDLGFGKDLGLTTWKEHLRNEIRKLLSSE
jgi:hypothetical protein